MENYHSFSFPWNPFCKTFGTQFLLTFMHGHKLQADIVIVEAALSLFQGKDDMYVY